MKKTVLITVLLGALLISLAVLGQATPQPAPAAKSDEPAAYGDSSVDDFHKVLHAMHVAIKDQKYDVLKTKMNQMAAARDKLVAALTEDADEITDAAAKKAHDAKAAMVEQLSKDVDALAAALKAGARPAIDEAFDKVHESFYSILKALDDEDSEAAKPEEKPAPKAEAKPAPAPKAEPKAEPKPADTKPADPKAAPTAKP